MRTQGALSGLFMLIASSTAVFSQNVITPVFPSKDGTVASDSCSGDQKELFADSARQAAGWMVFKSSGVNYMNIGSAMLAVYIKTVRKPGVCGIHSLMKRITGPENMVKIQQVSFDDMPIAALPLDSTFSDRMILVNITELVQSSGFYGIALRSIRGLSASFNSKEGFPPPVILVYRDSLNPYAQPKWWSAEDVPDTSVGKTGDFYVRAAKGVIYRKSPGVWDSVASLTIPPSLPATTAQHKKPLRRPSIKIPRR
jgi:hypothetical protein